MSLKGAFLSSKVFLTVPSPELLHTVGTLPTGIKCTYFFILLGLVQGSISCLLEKDFFHLPVLQVIQLADSILCPLYEVNENARWPLSANKVVLIEGGEKETDNEETFLGTR